MKTWIANTALVAVSIVASLLLLELGTRAWLPPQTIVAGRINLRANTTTTTHVRDAAGVDRTVVVTRNSLGLRGPEPSARDAKGLAVITVGGSTTESINFSHEDSWPGKLAAALNKEFHGAWLNNAGLNGQTTFGHLVLMADYVAPLKPDVILFLIGANDVGNNAPISYDKQTLRKRFSLRSRKAILEFAAQYSELGALALNLDRSYDAWKRGLRIGQIQPPPAKAESAANPARPSPPVIEDKPAAIAALVAPEFLDAYAARVRELVAASRRAGSLPVLVTQPYRAGPGPEDATYDGLWGLSARGGWSVLERYNDVVRRIAEETGTPVVDLAHELPHESQYFTDMIHFSAAGNIAVAHVIGGNLCPILARTFPGKVKAPCPPPAANLLDD